MENAAKALLIAGGVLIAILLLTLFSYLYTKMGESTNDIYALMNQSEISEFNQKFLNYSGRGINPNTTPLTVQDVATLINLAQDSKNNSDYAADISVNYEGNNLLETENYYSWLEQNQASNITFNCTVHVNEETLLVDRITIERHT